MRKFFGPLALTLCAALTMSFASCSSGDSDSEEKPATTYTVTFDSDGGSEVASQTVESGKTATKPADPTKSGEKTSYAFLGWYNGDSAFDFASAITADTTLKAKWLEDFVKVAGTTITGSETWVPESEVFVSGRSLTIPDLYVCDHEVTQAEYEKYCKYFSDTYRPDSTQGVGDNYPAYYVDWHDAIVYCNLRSIDEGLTPVYAISGETDPRKWEGIVSTTTDGATKYCAPSERNATWYTVTFDDSADGYRLPTEAEWEYIAREAGTSTTKYSGSDNIDDVAWYWDNSDCKTHEVKGKSANALGIYDMSGNVAELCWDWYVSISASTGPSGPSGPSGTSVSDHVDRGGNADGTEKYNTVSCRNVRPGGGWDEVGFRVVRSCSKNYTHTLTSAVTGGFVKVTGATITGSETWVPESEVFVSERKLTIRDLYVCDHEVTQAEYEKYCKYFSDTYRPNSTNGVGYNYPAYCVNWHDAIIYCNLRSIDEGLTPVYAISGETDPRKWEDIVSTTINGVTKYCAPSVPWPGIGDPWNATWNTVTFDDSADGYRLPTEAEWEYIAREAGTSITKYSGSDNIDDVAWYSSNSGWSVREVKGKVANSLGIYDMSGNVGEWCWDWYESISASTGPFGAFSTGGYRVYRGGSADNDKESNTVFRRSSMPGGCSDEVGFRVVRNAE